ncbi:MAG: serine hydrolase domain-containing protein, partial [Acidobacteriota bacterium]
MELEHIPPYPQTPISRARCFAAALALAAALPSAAFADSLSTAPGPGLPSGHGAGIDACVEQGLMRIGAPGAAVALVVDGELVFQKGYGVKRYGLPDPVGHRTLFKAGSVQKMMTAAAVMIQEQEGRLSLGDRVIQHVPELELGGPWPTRRIRVEDLLTHRSGVPDFSDLTCNDDLSTWAAGLGSTPLFAPAGAFYNYTNAGYSLAGLVAERAAGRSYADVMRDDVWGPAGMGSTVLTPAEALAYGDVSFGHGLDAQGQLEILAPDAYECPWAAPSGDFFTTAPDLARFALTLMDDGGDMLDADAADRMQAPVVATWDDPD